MLMTPKTISVIIVIGLLGYGSDRLLRYVRTRLTPWAVGLKVGE
jgi:ABC-type nitrate/sulfonate/bicarbonate transport system permease component